MVIVEKTESDNVFYWWTKWPFPMADRDYYFHRRGVVCDDGWYMIMSQSFDHDVANQPNKSCVRITGLESVTGIRKADGGGIEMVYFGFADPGGSIPNWLVNMVTSKLLEPALEKVGKECIKYGQLGHS